MPVDFVSIDFKIMDSDSKEYSWTMDVGIVDEMY